MCGLFGYNGVTSPNPQIIKLLWAFSSKRGTDGTGLYYNNKVVKFIYEHNKSSGNSFEVVYGSTLKFDDDASSKTVLGHCRSKTIGIVSLNNTHPFRYVDANHHHRWIFAHNGTIKNIDELEKKYQPKTEGATDSEALGWILANGCWDVLLEYKGAAACTLYNETTDTLYIWKGCSKHESSNLATDERPLCYYTGRNGIYYASEPEILATGVNSIKLKQFDSNVLYEIKNGKIVKMTPYNRSEIASFIPATYDYGYSDYSPNRPSYKPHSNNNKKKFVEPNPQQIAKGSVYYYNGRYYRQGHMLDGEFLLNDEGYYPKNNENSTKYYFKNGLMLRSADAFKEVNDMSPAAFKNLTSLIWKFSTGWAHPKSHVGVGLGRDNYYIYRDGKYIKKEWFRPIFSKYDYYANESGQVVEARLINDNSNPQTYTEIWQGALQV